jgi:hypothetical protein
MSPKEQAIQKLKDELKIATSMLIPIMLAEIAILKHGASLEEVNSIFESVANEQKDERKIVFCNKVALQYVTV